MASVNQFRRFFLRLLPSTFFGRLALLLFVAMLSSHVLALSLMLEIMPRPPFAPPGPLGPSHREALGAFALPVQVQAGFLVDILVRLGALMVAAWVGAKWLSDPMRQLAGAARKLGKDIHSPALPEQGTTECRETTRVFNQMQAQIRQQLGQRDQFVAAVSHDLRTPLTRLALRVEGLQDSQDRLRFGKDITEMDTMIRTTLDYLRGAADAEPWVPLDVGSLLESLAHDYQESGHKVQMVGRLHAAPLLVQASSLRRCITNVLENAVRYGDCARISLVDTPDAVHITIADDGPGIPPGELEKVLAPFYRLEASRNRNSGGVGLGLASASEIAQRHGGQLQLANAEDGGGLIARVTLARRVSSAPQS